MKNENQKQSSNGLGKTCQGKEENNLSGGVSEEKGLTYKGKRGTLGKKHKFKRIYHGLKNLPEYSIWGHMIQRCECPRNFRYKRYGGRGISVCNKWRISFLDFSFRYGQASNSKAFHRQDRQQRKLRTIQLSMGYAKGTGE